MKKHKNPVFWVSLITLALAAAGVDFETFTSWSIAADAFVGILKNPVALVAFAITAYGIWNDNSTKELDNPFKK